MSTPHPDLATTSVPPQVLLVNHLKALNLQSFVREYEKVAGECAAEHVDYPRYLLRLCELERIDRERRDRTAYSSGPLSPGEESRHLSLPGHSHTE
jgi:hypothetical protein